MATVHNITYSATNTAMTITLAALSNVAARCSNSIDNSSTLYLDASVFVQIGIGTTTGTDNAIYVYGYGGYDNSNFGGEGAYALGADGAVLTTPSNLPLLGVMSTNLFASVTSTNYQMFIGSVANSFGGVLPKYWGVVIDNRSGAALVNTATNHYVSYSGITATST